MQHKCAKCEAEDAEREQEPVHNKAEQEQVDEAPDSGDAVQHWDCSEYEAPTCVQSKSEDDNDAVQEKCSDCEQEDDVQHAGKPARGAASVHRNARRGIKGASEPLPHGGQIQSSFGRHDVSHVRTNTGGTAAAANRAMGSLAYTSGSRIGFRGPPSLRLAAHEAAHVVQQRGGVSLKDNVGRPGDRWENHADQVADAVVQGRSAEPLLDEVSGDSNSGSQKQDESVQHQITSGATRLFEPPPADTPPPAPEQTPSTETPGDDSGGASEPQSESGDTDGSAMEAAEEGAAEAPPEGVPADGAGGGAGGDAAGDAGGRQANDGAGGGGASCYGKRSEPPPDDTPDPTSDDRGSAPEEKPQVDFEPWPDAVDDCPAEAAVDQGAEQMPAGSGDGIAAGSAGAGAGTDAAAGAAPAGGEAMQAAEQTAAEDAGADSPSPQVREMARGAKQQADAAASENPMEGAIASALGERESAVSDYMGSSAGLDNVLTRSQNLTGNVVLPDAQGANQAEARQAAMSQIQNFMSNAAGQIASAVAFAQSEVPDRLGSLAEGLKANISGAIEAEKAAISASHHAGEGHCPRGCRIGTRSHQCRVCKQRGPD